MADAPDQVASLTDGKTVVAAASSVKKVRKFRLHPRPSAVLRNLKSLLDDAQLTPELEKAVESEIFAASDWLETAALFETIIPRVDGTALGAGARREAARGTHPFCRDHRHGDGD